ncbi:MAG: nucleotidyltransferase domain-containing protein [bacterium]
MDKKTALRIVKEYIDFLQKNEFNIQGVYIFGSIAKGHFNEDSDIDLAIIIKNLKNGFTMQGELMKLRRRFDLRIEPHPFDEMDFNDSNPFANEIMNTGIKVL